MAYIQVYLDNTLLSEPPINWEDFEESIERDPDIRGLLPKYPTRLTFTGDGYDYLKQTFEDDGYCSVVDVTFNVSCDEDGSFVEYFKGKIFISTCTFNLSKCQVETEVSDNNYAATIYNNKNIKANFQAPLSKNGVTITAPPLIGIYPHDCTDGTYYTSYRYGYNILDAFEYLIAFMSDGQIDFISSYFSSFTDSGKLMVMRGRQLRLYDAGSYDVTISFQELFIELNKKFNISFAMELQTNGRWRMRIENEAYFYQTGIAFKKRYIQDLKQFFNGQLLYSQINVGSRITVDDPDNFCLPDIQSITFTEENYYLQSICNNDNELDLVSDFIIDSNVFQDILQNNNDDYDNDICLIQYTGATLESTQFDLIPTAAIYNELLLNYKVIERWNVGSAVAKYTSDGNDNIVVEKTDNVSVSPVVLTTPSGSGSFLPVLYQTEVIDANNNWTSQQRFTSPADGLYSFGSLFYVTVSTNPNNPSVIWNNTTGTQIVFNILLNVYDASNVLQNTYTMGYANFTDNKFQTGSGINRVRDLTWPTGYNVAGAANWIANNNTQVRLEGFAENVVMPTGYYAEVECYYSHTILGTGSITFTAGIGSRLYTTFILNGGGILKESDTEDYKVSNYLFDQPVTTNEWSALKSNMANQIAIGVDHNANINTWVQKVSRKLKDGMTKFELVSNKNNV
jgi:hypothetical protein